MESHERFDEQLTQFIDKVAPLDLASEEATTAMKNLEIFSKCRPPAPEPQPEPDPVPTTALGKVKAGLGRFWNNETTQVLIKAGLPVVSVGLVTYATIRKDHVIERQAIAQANQRNS